MAFGSSTFTDFGGAVSDLFASAGHRAKAAGDRIEGQNYDLAASLAQQDVDYTTMSTSIKQTQLDRQIYGAIGSQEAQVAGAGFAASGSALDLLRDSASQGALTHAVTAEQGIIQEDAYRQQAKSYQNMSEAARMAASAEDNASTASGITSVIKAAAGIATLFI